MREIFGLDMTYIVIAVSIGFGLIVLSVGFLALLNRIIFKIGLRNIPRRPAQTALIVVGLMLSTLIISSALGTGDTIGHSIRNEVVKGLVEIDEILTANQGANLGLTGSTPYFPEERFDTLRAELSDFDAIDGMLPMIAERAPVANPGKQKSVGLMNIAAFDPGNLGVFGPLLAIDGSTANPIALTGADVFLNKTAAEELGAVVGDQLELFLQSGNVTLRVAGIVEGGGVAGDDETTLISLTQAQEIFNKPNQINSIVVSNKGDAESGADLSKEVTEKLRSLLTDNDVAQELKRLLNDPATIAALELRTERLSQGQKDDVLELAELLAADGMDDRLISLMADDQVAAQVLLAVESLDDEARFTGIFERFLRLRILTVQDIKADLLELSATIASGIMSIFIVFGLFSMMAGVMLIFLIFVMLAAERKPEMGIARAVGMKRRHLIQSFVYEGLAYDLMSALVGALLGIVVGLVLVTIMASIFASDDDGFELVRQYRWQSFVVSYCIGVVLTFITVFFSSYRASRLNIVSAIRDLPETFAASAHEPRLRMVLRALVRPFIYLVRAFKALIQLRIVAFFGNLALVAVRGFPLVWIVDIVWALVRAAMPELGAGWLTVILGVLLAALGLVVTQAAPFAIGTTLTIIGIGLMIRKQFANRGWDARQQGNFTAVVVAAVSLFWLIVGISLGNLFTITLSIVVVAFEAVRQAAMRREATVSDSEDRNVYTFIGLALILYWGVPFDSLDWIVPDLESNIAMFFISGICMVAAAVWVVIYNADLITNALTAVLGRFSKIRPSLKTAIAYPLNSRLRTGLTLAMLALVIFTLIVMSSLTSSFNTVLEDIDSVTGSWDIVATVSYNNPIEDIEADLPELLGAEAGNINAVGGYTTLPIEARQIGAEEQEWKSYTVRGATADYLEATGHGFAITAEDYGDGKEGIWKALREDPTLGVIDSIGVPARGGGGFIIGGPQFKMEGFFIEDDEMPATEIEIREPRSGAVAKVTIIAVLDLVADQFGVIMFDKATLDGISPDPLPLTTYRFRLGEGVDAGVSAESLEAAFLANGLETQVLADELEEDRQANVALNNLLQGFMASGLLVGIAALGVISLRSVVERRQQIGVLRAIGYRRSMVLASFLMESSFIALLGIFLGVGLGTLLAFNLVTFIGEQIPGLRFSMPWFQIVLIVTLAYLFSLLTTFLPARQASRIYPAQALRYE
ncbi:MAG: FtsX-like permease family protein [Dehalococcoidia bacterium]